MILTIVEAPTDEQIARARRFYPIPNLQLRGPKAKPLAVDDRGELFVETRAIRRPAEVYWFHLGPDERNPFAKLYRSEYA